MKLIQTGETTNLPQPPGVLPDEWWPNAWFPDGTRFITAGFEPGQEASAWVASILGGPPRKIRDNADPWSVSPDGTLIAFGTGDTFIREREIWVMGPQGEDARKLVSGSEDEGFFHVVWLPDGQRFADVRYHRKPEGNECSIETRDLKGGQPILVWSDPRLCDHNTDLVWLPSGRFLFSMLEPEKTGTYFNLWEIEANPRTGAPVSKPRQVTRWTEVQFAILSVTSDGKQLAVTKWTEQSDVYVGELAAGGRQIENIHRLTLTENENYPSQWMRDSKTVLFWSNRNGAGDIFKQALDQTEAEPVVTGPDYKQQPILSPDGSWILYLSSATTDLRPTTPMRIMRVPVSGGSPQLVLEGKGITRLACARPPSANCVFSEPTADGKQVVFSSFDPMRGRIAELTKINCQRGCSWDLSPDGLRIAFAEWDQRVGHIRILQASGVTIADLDIKGWHSLYRLSWAADGKELFVAAAGAAASEHVDLLVALQGRVQVLWQHDRLTGNSDEARWVPSPNGRYFAVPGQAFDNNVWLLENF